MAKKRRGRPPGSKNKKKTKGKARGLKLGNFATMELGELRDYIGQLKGVLEKKIGEQRTALERQLASLTEWGAPTRSGRPAKAARKASMQKNDGTPKKVGTRKKAEPKYQSKSDKSLKWSGRGMTPVWMREEMKGTQLKKEDFAIE